MPNRGVITDRNGVVLAHNYSAFTLEITPPRSGKLEETIDALAEVIDIQPKDRKRFKRLLDEAKNLRVHPIRTRLERCRRGRQVLAQRYRFPGVEVKAACSASIRWGMSPRTPSATSAASPTAT